MFSSSERYIKIKAVVLLTTAFIVVPIEPLSHSVNALVSLDFFSQFCIEIKEQFWVVFRDYFSWLVRLPNWPDRYFNRLVTLTTSNKKTTRECTHELCK